MARLASERPYLLIFVRDDHGGCRVGCVPSGLDQRTKLAQVFAFANHDEVPGLKIDRTGCEARRLPNAAQDLLRNVAIFVFTHRHNRSHYLENLVRHASDYPSQDMRDART
jgi:hypothetical protein